MIDFVGFDVQALHDLSDLENPRLVDGIVLTKFDTIDDKVGAALSMVYCTGKPIVFVGTGQKYTNLKRLNVKDVVNLLLNQLIWIDLFILINNRIITKMYILHITLRREEIL